MKTIEELLKLLPESIYIDQEKYYEILGEEWELSFEDCPDEEAYIAITTNSARYKIRDYEGGHWTDLIVFHGNPQEATNKLYEWYLSTFKDYKYI